MAMGLVVILTLALTVTMLASMVVQFRLFRRVPPGAESEFRKAMRWFRYDYAAQMLPAEAGRELERLRSMHVAVGVILVCLVAVVVVAGPALVPATSGG
jgi:hypothetical protein